MIADPTAAAIIGWCAIAYALVVLFSLAAVLIDARWLETLARTWRRLIRAWIIWRYLGRPWRIAIDRAWRIEP